MKAPFPMPDEYVQGFLKAAQSLSPSLLTSPVSPNAIAAPPNGAPPTEIQLGYPPLQRQLWGRMFISRAAAEPVVAADRGDRRVNSEAWRDNPGYGHLKQSDLFNSRLLSETVEAADLEAATKHCVRFYAERNPADPHVASVAEANLTYVAIDDRGRPRPLTHESR